MRGLIRDKKRGGGTHQLFLGVEAELGIFHPGIREIVEDHDDNPNAEEAHAVREGHEHHGGKVVEGQLGGVAHLGVKHQHRGGVEIIRKLHKVKGLDQGAVEDRSQEIKVNSACSKKLAKKESWLT